MVAPAKYPTTVDPTDVIGIWKILKRIPKTIAHKGMKVRIFLTAVFIVPPNNKINMKLKTTKIIEVETSQNTALIKPALPKIP